MSNSSDTTVLQKCRIEIQSQLTLDAGAAVRGLEHEVGQFRAAREVHTVVAWLTPEQIQQLNDTDQCRAILKQVRNGPSAETIHAVTVEVLEDADQTSRRTNAA